MGTPLAGFSTDPANPLSRVGERYVVPGALPIGLGPRLDRGLVFGTGSAHMLSMGAEPEQHYTVKVKDRHIGLNPYKWAIYRASWPRAVKSAASVYGTAEKCRTAGTLALREFLSNIAKRKKKKDDG